MARNCWAFRPLISLFVVVFGLSVAFAPASAGSSDDDAVQAFAQQNIDRGIAVLKNKDLTDAERRAQVHDILTELLDTTKIGLFALGPARATAPSFHSPPAVV